MAFLDKSGLTYFWSKIQSALSGKVDKVSGKGLSTNDYTTTEKNKLASITLSATNFSLAAASWVSLAQTVSITGLTANSNGILSLAQTATASEQEAAADAGLTISSVSNGSITITCTSVPTIDLPCTLIIL